MINFFCPDIDMVQWLIDYAGSRKILDVGCGNGTLIKAINRQEPGKAFGIDIRWQYDDPSLPIYQLDSTQTGLISECPGDILMLFCRPCHGTWFERTVDRIPESVETLYIGLPDNLEIDFYKYRYELIEHKGSSDDKEQVFRVIK